LNSRRVSPILSPVSEVRIRAALVVALSAALIVSVQGQQPAPKVGAIPSIERYVPQQGLRVRLTVKKPAVAAFEDPGFTVHLDNVGATTIYVNRSIAPNLYIYGKDGALIPPVSGWITEAIVVELKRGTLTALRPGQTFSRPVRAEQHPRYDMGNGASYTDRSSDTGRLMLGAGSYTARFVYVNTPGFPNEYGPRNIPDVWEGRIESEPVAFTVAPGAESALSALRPTVPKGVKLDPPWPVTVEAAERDLASDDQRQFMIAAHMLERLHSTSSLGVLRARLSDPVPWKRASAARTILQLDDERGRDVALSLVDSDDAALRSLALYWLAKRCTTAILPMLEQRLAPPSPDWSLAAGHCGESGAFVTLRPLIGSRDERVRVAALNGLFILTFEGQEDGEITWRATPADWDRWYERHKSESRRLWAERQIRGNRRAAFFAVDYLRRTNDPQMLPALRRAASGRDAVVRITAARGIVQFDRREGIALLKRELENRHPGRCAEAQAALNELTNHDYAFDFHVPAERRQAIDAFAAVVQ
jgi:HEAT repeat protein